MPASAARTQTTIPFHRRKTGTRVTQDPLKPGQLPLSPRKRLGDDNLCNVSAPPPHCCSPPKRTKENQYIESLSKLETSRSPAANGSRERQASHETPHAAPRRETERGRLAPVIQLFKRSGSRYQETKQVLHTGPPDRLLARSGEAKAIQTFLRKHVPARQPGSLYISGPPGTGKTALLTRLLPDMQEEFSEAQTITINCMSLRSSQAVFRVIADQLCGRERLKCSGKDIPRRLARQLSSSGPMVLLVLDEMDQLDSKAQDVLYTVFEWPWLPSSRLVLIGIANALDLTDRILPRLQARHCRPQLLNFPPYTRSQIVDILQDRLSQVPGENVVDDKAVQFCAGKVSSLSGDARKALDVCRRAVEMVEWDVRCQTLLKPGAECSVPGRVAPTARLVKVSMPHVSRVMCEVYGDRMRSGSGAEQAFPLQQKLLVCSLLLVTRDTQVREVTLGKLHEIYRKVCSKQMVSGVGQAECLSLCSLLEARGILAVKHTREPRLSKVALKIEEKDVEHALQDKVLMGNILREGLS